MRRLTAVVLAIQLALPVVGLAQLKSQQSNRDIRRELGVPSPSSGVRGILGLDPSKFQMQHSYSMSFYSYGGHTFSQGLYLNTMTYRFSPKLVAKLQLGMLHQPFGSFGSPVSSSQIFVSGAELRFRPMRNVLLHIQYGIVPYGYGYGQAYGRRYGWRPYSPYLDDRGPWFEEER